MIDRKNSQQSKIIDNYCMYSVTTIINKYKSREKT